ncbi:MAG TPA: hypothetical protein VG758_28690 [Hyphomicrobiaceae bacterium]|jgi:hypothetical protein|nr:hypothetical protein [Hyphomicrobiaceae bacterium]
MPVPVDVTAVLLTALLNPVMVVVAVWMGRGADQWQKLPVAAFAAALAGTVAYYAGVRLGVVGAAGTARAAAGIFIAQFVFALAWAYAGYHLMRRAP